MSAAHELALGLYTPSDRSHNMLDCFFVSSVLISAIQKRKLSVKHLMSLDSPGEEDTWSKHMNIHARQMQFRRSEIPLRSPHHCRSWTREDAVVGDRLRPALPAVCRPFAATRERVM